MERDVPGGPVVKNPPSNARVADSTPGYGIKILHASGQLSPQITAREKPVHGNKKISNAATKIPPADAANRQIKVHILQSCQ